MIAVILFVLGAIFGSFAGALAYRLKNQKDFVRARSQCESCGHVLSVADLVPVFSWLLLRGRCRYCGQKIGQSALWLEVVLGTVFAASYIFWPQTLVGGQWLLLVSWLASAVGLAALAFYDLKWMILPNHILYPTFFVALTGRIAYILSSAPNKGHDSLMLLLGIVIASGLFWLIYVGSQGKLIGYGDVRLGLVTGTLLADPQLAGLMIFLASAIGTVFVLPSMAKGKAKMSSRLPFGPFLILATAITLLFGGQMIDWYRHLLA